MSENQILNILALYYLCGNTDVTIPHQDVSHLGSGLTERNLVLH